jgi:hypothetical protein
MSKLQGTSKHLIFIVPSFALLDPETKTLNSSLFLICPPGSGAQNIKFFTVSNFALLDPEPKTLNSSLFLVFAFLDPAQNQRGSGSTTPGLTDD